MMTSLMAISLFFCREIDLFPFSYLTILFISFIYIYCAQNGHICYHAYEFKTLDCSGY